MTLDEFGTVYEKRYNRELAYASARLTACERDSNEDIVQTAALKLIRHADRVRHPTVVFRRAVRHASYDYGERLRLRRKHEIGGYCPVELPSKLDDPEAVYGQAELLRRVLAVVATLPPIYRDEVMRRLNGGHVLNQQHKTRYGRAVNLLRGKLAAQGITGR